MKHYTKVAACLLIASAVIEIPPVSFAQQPSTRNSIKVTFPTPDWKETEAPLQLREAYDGVKTPARPVFHAVSEVSRLRLHITKFGYPEGPKELLLAGYLDGVRRRCARQASGKVRERIDQGATIPTQTFEVDIPGNLFLEIRAMLCADRVYLLEVGGPASSHAEADRCLEGVSIAGESPLPADVISGLSQTRAKTGVLRTAYERGRGLGRLIGAGLVVIVVAGMIAIVFFASRSRRKQPKQTSSAGPPPIPS